MSFIKSVKILAATLIAPLYCGSPSEPIKSIKGKIEYLPDEKTIIYNLDDKDEYYNVRTGKVHNRKNGTTRDLTPDERKKCEEYGIIRITVGVSSAEEVFARMSDAQKIRALDFYFRQKIWRPGLKCDICIYIERNNLCEIKDTEPYLKSEPKKPNNNYFDQIWGIILTQKVDQHHDKQVDYIKINPTLSAVVTSELSQDYYGTRSLNLDNMTLFFDKIQDPKDTNSFQTFCIGILGCIDQEWIEGHNFNRQFNIISQPECNLKPVESRCIIAYDPDGKRIRNYHTTMSFAFKPNQVKGKSCMIPLEALPGYRGKKLLQIGFEGNTGQIVYLGTADRKINTFSSKLESATRFANYKLTNTPSEEITLDPDSVKLEPDSVKTPDQGSAKSRSMFNYFKFW